MVTQIVRHCKWYYRRMTSVTPITPANRGELYDCQGILLVAAAGASKTAIIAVRPDGTTFTLNGPNVSDVYPLRYDTPIKRINSTNTTYDATIYGIGNGGVIPNRPPRFVDGQVTKASVRRDVASKTKLLDLEFEDPDDDGITINTTLTVVSKPANSPTDTVILGRVTLEAGSGATAHQAEVFYTRPTQAANELPVGNYVFQGTVTDTYDSDSGMAGNQGAESANFLITVTILPGDIQTLTNLAISEHTSPGSTAARTITKTPASGVITTVVESDITALSFAGTLGDRLSELSDYKDLFARRDADLEFTSLLEGVTSIPIYVIADDDTYATYDLQVDKRHPRETLLDGIVNTNTPAVALSPTFAPETLAYEMTIGGTVTGVSFGVTKRRTTQAVHYRTYATGNNPPGWTATTDDADNVLLQIVPEITIPRPSMSGDPDHVQFVDLRVRERKMFGDGRERNTDTIYSIEVTKPYAA